jgi:hypothetical protein
MRAHRRAGLAIVASTAALWGCASSTPPPPTTFVPQGSAGVQTLYRNGSTYAALPNPRGPVLVTLKPVVLSDRPFVQLWLHVQNRQVRPFRIDPEDIYLERRLRGSGDTKRIEPESEDDVLALLESRARAQAGGSLLRRTAVPPGESLQGVVYFRFPAPVTGRRRARADEAYAYDLTVHLPTPDGPRRILLRPVPART